MKKLKGPSGPSQNKTECFSISVYRHDNGYSAKARILTKKGYIDFAASASRQDFAVGAISDPPKIEAIKEALDQADAFVNSALGRELVPRSTQYAVLTTQIARDAAEKAQDGDQASQRTLFAMEGSSNPVLRKAAKISGLLEE